MEKEQTKRWSEDVGVDPLLRQVIANARNEAPDAASLERVIAGVITGIEGGPLGHTGAEQSPAEGGSPSAAIGSVGQMGMAKVAAAATVICALSAIVGIRLLDNRDGQKSIAPTAQELKTANEAARAATVLEQPKPKSEEPMVSVAGKKTISEPRSKLKGGKPSKRDLERNPAEEVRLLRRAKRALSSEPKETLRMTREHELRFGDGKFVEEREALAIEALHGIGRRSEALRLLGRFKRRWPRSVYLRRIEERLVVGRHQSE